MLDERREEMWDDYFATSDAIRERYASELKDLRMYEESENEHYEYMWKVKEAGFGEDTEAYEASWSRTIERGEESIEENGK
jgi:hypothetical protein